MPIQSPNLKREEKKLFSLSAIKQIEDQKISDIIKKRLKQHKVILKKQKCQKFGHNHTITIPSAEIYGCFKKKKRDDDVDYYDPVTHAIDPIALRAGYRSKHEK